MFGSLQVGFLGPAYSFISRQYKPLRLSLPGKSMVTKTDLPGQNLLEFWLFEIFILEAIMG